MKPAKPHSKYPSLQKFYAVQDENSLLHAVCNALSSVYVTENYHSKPLRHKEFIENLRKQMAVKLTHVNRYDPNKKTFFNSIDHQGKTLDGLRKTFDSKEKLGVETAEYLSLLMACNIYVVEGDTIEVSGGPFDRSIVLLHHKSTGYFSTGAYKNEQGVYETMFGHQHPLLKELLAHSISG